MLEQERTRELQTLLNRLPPGYCTPLVLRYWEDYSYEQIAETMGLTKAAVKSRLFRARKQMADLFQAVELMEKPNKYQTNNGVCTGCHHELSFPVFA